MRETGHMFTIYSAPVNHSGCGRKLALGITVFLNLLTFGYPATRPPTFAQCNSHLSMDEQQISQAELALWIRDTESSTLRVSCDFRIHAGAGQHVMFYFTDVYLGNPNMSERLDKACIEPRDVITDNRKDNKESVPPGIRPLICAANEVEIGSRVYVTTGSGLTLRFYRNRGFSINVHFRLIFTAFRLGSCRTSERKCKNDRCIQHDLVCNDYNPCGDFSDCPTGLEHLSSWTMSGIVILGLLSGGIVIIMAAVCLQRTGSKRYDLDDFSSVSLGPKPNDNAVEMNDVTTGPSPHKASRDGTTNRRNTSRDGSKLNLTEEASHIPLCRAAVAEPADITDKDTLIQLSGRSPETCSEEFGQPESNSSAELLQNSTDIITVSSEILDTKGASYDPCLLLDGYATSTFYSDSNRPRSSQRMPKTLSFPDKSLMYSESDIGYMYDGSKPSLDHLAGQGNMLKTFKMPSSSPNRKIIIDDRHGLSDFQNKAKQPPAYNYVLKHDTVFHASPGNSRPHKL